MDNVGDICFDSNILGTKDHLIVSSGKYSWASLVPLDHWHLSGTIKDHSSLCLDTLFRLNSTKINIDPDQKWRNMSTSVFSDLSHPPWQRLMPARAHQAFVKRLVGDVLGVIGGLDTGYYERSWVPSGAVFRSLDRAYIDNEKLLSALGVAGNKRSVVESFMPDRLGFVNRTIYNRFGTRTGRLTVTSGPQILTLDHNFRNVLTSLYGDAGVIMSLDCNALEARVVLYESDKDCVADDLYSSIGSTLLGIPLDRKIIKAAIISEMYGMSKKKLCELTDLSTGDALIVVKSIKRHFGIVELLKRLRAQHVANNFIMNHDGRRLEVPDPANHMLINTFAQSTGVDVSLSVFAKIIEDAKLTSKSLRPLFLLHDALIVDVHKDDAQKYFDAQHVKIDSHEQSFVVKGQIFNA